MTLVEMLPSIRTLSRGDKLQLIQALISELAREEGVDLAPGSTIPIWSPHNAHEAAETLLEALASHGAAG